MDFSLGPQEEGCTGPLLSYNFHRQYHLGYFERYLKVILKEALLTAIYHFLYLKNVKRVHCQA